MLEKHAKTFRDGALILALLVFIVGVIDVIMLAFDLSLGTGLMLKMGFHPRSFASGTVCLLLVSIAFGLIRLDQSKS